MIINNGQENQSLFKSSTTSAIAKKNPYDKITQQ